MVVFASANDDALASAHGLCSPSASLPVVCSAQFSDHENPYYFDAMQRAGLLEFTDLEDEHGTLDLDKCADDDLPKTWRAKKADKRKMHQTTKRTSALPGDSSIAEGNPLTVQRPQGSMTGKARPAAETQRRHEEAQAQEKAANAENTPRTPRNKRRGSEKRGRGYGLTAPEEDTAAAILNSMGLDGMGKKALPVKRRRSASSRARTASEGASDGFFSQDASPSGGGLSDSKKSAAAKEPTAAAAVSPSFEFVKKAAKEISRRVSGVLKGRIGGEPSQAELEDAEGVVNVAETKALCDEEEEEGECWNDEEEQREGSRSAELEAPSPELSRVFKGGSPTTWMLRLLAAFMSRDAVQRERLAICLAAIEEKNFRFAERVLRDSVDRRNPWLSRLLSHCYKAMGKKQSAEDIAQWAADGCVSQEVGSIGSVGRVFELVMDMEGDPGDWSHVAETAGIHAAQYPADALQLMLHGGVQWRLGRLTRAVGPLRDAMLHDGDDGRAAPWLFEVHMRLGDKDNAEWVRDKAYEIDERLIPQLDAIAKELDDPDLCQGDARGR